MIKQRTAILLLLALAGVASLALVPFDTLLGGRELPVPIAAVALGQPAVLAVLAVLLGARFAPAVGLGTPVIDAVLARRAAAPIIRGLVGPILGGIAASTAVLLIYFQFVGLPLLASAPPDSPMATLEMPLLTRVLYGGLTEEILMRWGLLSLFAWIGWRIAGRPPAVPAAAAWAAIILAAGLFAAGHLPMLALLAPDASVGVMAGVLLGNLAPGVIFGWLYVRHGLEAAMFAHAGAHLASFSALLLTGH